MLEDTEFSTADAPAAEPSVAASGWRSFNHTLERWFAPAALLYGRYPGFLTVAVLAAIAAVLQGDLGTGHEWYGGEALAQRALAEQVIKGEFPPGGPYPDLPTHLPPLYSSLIGVIARLSGANPFRIVGWASVAAAALLPLVAYLSGMVVFRDWRPAAAGAALVTLGAGFSKAHLGEDSLFTSGQLFAPLTPLDIGLLLIPPAVVLFIRAAESDAVRYGVYVGVIAAVLAVTHLQSVVYLMFVLLALGLVWLGLRPLGWRRLLAIDLTIAAVGMLLSAWWWGPQVWTGAREGGITMTTVAAAKRIEVGPGEWPAQFGLLLPLALAGAALAVVVARRTRRLAPVLVVTWLIVPLGASAFLADALPLEATLRADRLALLASFPMALLAGLAVTDWRRLVPAPGIYSFALAAGIVALAALPTTGRQREIARQQSEPIYGGRIWYWRDPVTGEDGTLAFAAYLRDRANATGTATVVGDDPETGIAWFLAGNRSLAWNAPPFYAMAYNEAETTGKSEFARLTARAEALSGNWRALEAVANEEEIRFAVLPVLDDRVALSLATARDLNLGVPPEQRGHEVQLLQTDDGLAYLRLEPGAELAYQVSSDRPGEVPFTVRVRSTEPGPALQLETGSIVADVEVLPEEVGQWVEIPLALPLLEGENALRITAVAPVELAAVYGYTERLDDVPPGFRVRFDDGFTVVLEIPRI